MGLEGALRDLGLKAAEMRFGEPLGRHTSLGIGGRAEVYARPGTARDLARILAFDWQMPVYFLGGGTNILIMDEDIKALFISTGGLKGIEVKKLSRDEFLPILSVRAGESLKGVLAFCMKNGLSGLEPLTGIPGSVGGAVAGNAGAHGLEIGDVIRLVRVMGEKGGIKEMSGEEMGFFYRGSALLAKGTVSPDGLIIGAELALKPGSPMEIRALMARNFNIKKKTQPLQARSAGCVFKNPEGRAAGSLIEEAGFKGARVGGVEVSVVHANFFINRGDGSAEDFLRLMDKVSDGVEKRFGIRLEPEIRILD